MAISRVPCCFMLLTLCVPLMALHEETRTSPAIESSDISSNTRALSGYGYIPDTQLYVNQAQDFETETYAVYGFYYLVPNNPVQITLTIEVHDNDVYYCYGADNNIGKMDCDSIDSGTTFSKVIPASYFQGAHRVQLDLSGGGGSHVGKGTIKLSGIGALSPKQKSLVIGLTVGLGLTLIIGVIIAVLLISRSRKRQLHITPGNNFAKPYDGQPAQMAFQPQYPQPYANNNYNYNQPQTMMAPSPIYPQQQQMYPNMYSGAPQWQPQPTMAPPAYPQPTYQPQPVIAPPAYPQYTNQNQPATQLTKDQINHRFPPTKHSQVKNKHPTCSSCGAKFIGSIFCQQLDCKHLYHVGCLETLMQTSNNCASCNSEIIKGLEIQNQTSQPQIASTEQSPVFRRDPSKKFTNTSQNL